MRNSRPVLAAALLLFLLPFAFGSQDRSSALSAQGDNGALGTFLLPGWTAEKVFHAAVLPEWVRNGPNDEILFRSGREHIYEVQADGGVTVYETFWPGFLEVFDFDSSGRLWMTSNKGEVWRMNDSDQPERVTAPGVHVNRYFAIDSQDNLIAIDVNGIVQRIMPDGSVSILAQGFGELSFPAIGPNDEVAVIDKNNGILSIINTAGQITAAIPGFPEVAQDPVFSPDGELYVIGWSGLYRVDIQNKTSSKVAWFDDYLGTGDTADFDHQGRLIVFHANIPIYRFDLDAETGEMVYFHKSNTMALAVSPDGEVYVAYANLLPLPLGETTVFRAASSNTLEEIATVPFGRALALTFAPDGTGYVSVGDIEVVGKIYEFDAATGATAEVVETNASSLAVNPVTGHLAWWAGDAINQIDELGQINSIPLPADVHFVAFDFMPDGTLYAGITFNAPGPFAPMTRGVYRLEANGAWTELWANTPDFRFTGIIAFALCADGSSFVTGFFDGELLPDIPESHSSMLLRLSPQGELARIAFDIPIDTFAAACDKKTGQIFTTGLPGVTKFYQWASDYLFLPRLR